MYRVVPQTKIGNTVRVILFLSKRTMRV